MDIETLRIFVKVAELASFTSAGEHLNMPKSRVSLRVRELETQLGSRLLQRSTRVVRLTSDGEQFLPRARQLVVEADDLSSMFQAPSSLRGRVRMDLPVVFARTAIIPRFPELFALHPQLEITVSATDRRVELVREGFDFVLRVGNLGSDSTELIARRLGALPMTNCASPAYLRKYGTPKTLEDLDRHFVVHYSQSLGSEKATFEYPDGKGPNKRYRDKPMKSIVTVNSADSYQAACLAGLGIIQTPRAGTTLAGLADGSLVELLPDLTCEPMPVSIVQSSRNAPKRVRVVMNWLADVMKPQLDEP